MASSPNANATSARNAHPARPRPARPRHQPVADRGATAVDLLQPQPDGADTGRDRDDGFGDDEREAVPGSGAVVLALDEGASGVVRVGVRHRRDGGDEGVARGLAHEGEVRKSEGAEDDGARGEPGDAQRRRRAR